MTQDLEHVEYEYGYFFYLVACEKRRCNLESMLTYDWKIKANGRIFKDKIRDCIEVTQRLK